MKKASVPLRLATVCLVAMLASCSKDPPPKPDDGPKKTTPVPSDMVFNDFVPPTGAGGGIVGVKGADGGLEAGDLGTASTGDGGGGAAAAGGGAPEDANALKVTDPGAEPRVARRYAFVANKSEKRVLTIKQSASREGGGPAQELPAIAISMELTAKVVKPTGARFEVKILGVDVPEAPAAQKAQIAAQLGTFKGLTGQFDISKQGDVGEVDFKADERMQGQAAEMIIGGLQQALELLVPAFPDAPVGVGGKWERTAERRDRGTTQIVKASYTLKDAAADGGTVHAEIDLTVPKTVVQQRGLPPGTTVEVKKKDTYTYAFKLAGVSTRVDGDSNMTQKLEVSDGKQKQSQSQVAKTKLTLDSK